MTWREATLKYLKKERDDLKGRISHWSKTTARLFEGEGSQMVDVTEKTLERDKSELAEIESLIELAEDA